MSGRRRAGRQGSAGPPGGWISKERDRKSTRLNSSHSQISYAVFCLKKKKKKFNSTSYSPSNVYYTTITEAVPALYLHIMNSSGHSVISVTSKLSTTRTIPSLLRLLK